MLKKCLRAICMPFSMNCLSLAHFPYQLVGNFLLFLEALYLLDMLTICSLYVTGIFCTPMVLVFNAIKCSNLFLWAAHFQSQESFPCFQVIVEFTCIYTYMVSFLTLNFWLICNLSYIYFEECIQLYLFPNNHPVIPTVLLKCSSLTPFEILPYFHA